MKKKLLVGFSILCGLGIIAGAVLIWSINPIIERMRPRIVAQISGTIGHPVEIEKLEASLFPSIAINVSGVKLADSKDETSLKSIKLATSLTELIRAKVVVRALSIEGATLTITRKADGNISIGSIALGDKTNEKKRASLQSTPKSKKQGSASSDKDKSEDSSIDFALEQAELKDINLTWVDQSVSPAQRIQISNLKSEITNIGGSEPGTINLSASLLGTSSNNLALSGTINLANMNIAQASTDLSLALEALDLKKVTTIASAYGSSVPELSVDHSADVLVKLKTVSGGFRANLELDASDAEIKYASSFVKPKSEIFKINTAATLALNGRANVSTLRATLGKIALDIPLQVKSKGRIEAHVKGSKVGLNEIGKFIPAAAPYKLDGAIDLDLQTTISGGKGASPQLSGDITLREVAADVALGDGENLLIRNLSGPLTFDKNNLTTKGATLTLNGEPLTIEAKVESAIDPKNIALVVDGFGGRIIEHFAFPVNAPGSFTTATNAEAVDAAKLWAIARPKAKNSLTGNIEKYSSKLSADSNSVLQSLRGPADLRITKGSITGVNIFGETIGQIGSIPGISASLETLIPPEHHAVLSASDTAFNLLSVDLRFTGGEIRLANAELKHDVYEISGNGIISLVSEDMRIATEMRLTPVIAEQMFLAEPRLKLLADNNGNIAFPVYIKRKGGSLKVQPDLKLLLSRATKNTAKEAAGRALDRVAPGLGGSIGGAIDSLWK